jgi:hypothetical protein
MGQLTCQVVLASGFCLFYSSAKATEDAPHELQKITDAR